MTEIIKGNDKAKESTYIAIASAIGLASLAFLSLFVRSRDNLTQAKENMAYTVLTTERCNDAYGCSLVPTPFCDGNNTMFDFSDDVCESIPYMVSNYSR